MCKWTQKTAVKIFYTSGIGNIRTKIAVLPNGLLNMESLYDIVFLILTGIIYFAKTDYFNIPESVEILSDWYETFSFS